MELENLRLTKTSAGNYKGSDGAVYRIRKTDRGYKQSKAPTYYLSRFATGLKPQYLSGLFATQETGIYTLDLRDEYGIKHYFKIDLSQDILCFEQSVTTSSSP